MMWRQVLIIGGAVLAAVLIELTLLSRLDLPGATPDLVVVTIVAIALAMGPMQGAAAGFTAGILVDLAPPADTLLGVNAIVYIAIGFVTGFVIDPRDRTVPIEMGIVGLSAAAATLGTAALDTLLGSGRVSWEDMPGMALSSALYAVILAPLVILAVAWIVQKATPEILVT
ncbi:MAG: rod shape-determining protein MreD [Actinobacteria bacterium]|jgi:rod shape-determining protein MreD|nr:rod shape-determining protein MreD [Actinomycetota bacterium]